MSLHHTNPCRTPHYSFMTVITRGVPRPDPARESDSGLYEPVR